MRELGIEKEIKEASGYTNLENIHLENGESLEI
jgi:hypothetical protein